MNLYTPYGYSAATSSTLGILAFCGEPVDRTTQSYLLGQGYRSYQPFLMRFCQPDRMSPFGEGGVNSYAFVGNDPVNYTDPTGGFRLFRRGRTYSGQAKVVDLGFAFMAKHPTVKGKRAITAIVHGQAGAVEGERRPVSAARFAASLDKKGFETSRYDIHIISCMSGDPAQDRQSFIQSLSNITGRNAHGYSGTVTANPTFGRTSNALTPIKVRVVSKLPSYAEYKKDFVYQPRVASPQKAIRDPG
ncbi:hypothetical protein E6B08_02095 [Pseudomonas putida]|uniref:RHS repeat-associated core domain-containing protein n=1 Tax=Pseudomonas putida TaxID=303 RepID=A0A4D6X4Z6_PSEPU|nr:RHS repeat-associated core domain-containing protein [Pseudomonas putida]QCI10282.1 hypothetical protein E6B08_02095 [Pseudomonas putida]